MGSPGSALSRNRCHRLLPPFDWSGSSREPARRISLVSLFFKSRFVNASLLIFAEHFSGKFMGEVPRKLNERHSVEKLSPRWIPNKAGHYSQFLGNFDSCLAVRMHRFDAYSFAVSVTPVPFVDFAITVCIIAIVRSSAYLNVQTKGLTLLILYSVSEFLRIFIHKSWYLFPSNQSKLYF